MCEAGKTLEVTEHGPWPCPPRRGSNRPRSGRSMRSISRPPRPSAPISRRSSPTTAASRRRLGRSGCRWCRRAPDGGRTPGTQRDGLPRRRGAGSRTGTGARRRTGEPPSHWGGGQWPLRGERPL